MKIERISDNQIRCTLTKADLAGKETLLNDLAFGSNNAQDLFQDLMKQASDQLGFDTDNAPLMVEAIPKSKECLILIITKVDADKNSTKHNDKLGGLLHAATGKLISGNPDEFLDMLGQLPAESFLSETENETAVSSSDTSSYVFSFDSLEDVGHIARLIKDYPHESELYKDDVDGQYYLWLSSEDNTYDFKPILNILNEYSGLVPHTYATNALFREHLKIILAKNAIELMSQL